MFVPALANPLSLPQARPALPAWDRLLSGPSAGPGAAAGAPDSGAAARAESLELGALGGPEADLERMDRAFMELALEEARAAAKEDEVPVGAVVVSAGKLLSRAHNRTRNAAHPLAHAEMQALAQAFHSSGQARLVGATVYTTLEPCFMCAGALSHARVARVVWAVRDPKFGALASLGAVLSDPRLNHRAELKEGVCASEARDLLQSFFRSKRA